MLQPAPVLVAPSVRGRQVKFTPERIEQIKNLVERGTRREEIAETIGVTLGSLQVTCSRLGISLRRRRIDNGVGVQSRPPSSQGVATMRPKLILTNGAPTDGEKHFGLKLEYGDSSVRVPIDKNSMTKLILEAELRGVRSGELLAQLIHDFIERDDHDTH